MNLRRNRQQDARSQSRNDEVDQRSGHGDAHISFPCEYPRLDGALGFIEQRDSANRQQDDSFRGNASAHPYQRVSQFVQHDATENDAYQSQSAAGVGRTVPRRLGQPHWDQQ